MRIGVGDFYIATATYTPAAGSTAASVTYGTPAKIGGTASVNVTLNKGENKVYESDVLIRNTERVASATVSYKSHTVSLADEMKYLYNVTLSQSATNYEDGPSNTPPSVAVGFSAPLADGTFLCVWYYWATGSKGDESFETATDNENTPEDEFKFQCMPDPINKKLRRRAIAANAAAVTAFFNSVMAT